MRNFSRGTWLALAAIVAIPATIAIAKTVDGAGWRMTLETRARLEEGRLAMVKTALQLNPEQEKLWAPVEQQIREAFKAREAQRAAWEKTREERRAERAAGSESKRPDLAERFERMSKRMSERTERMKSFSAAFTPFYASLSDEQKETLRPLACDLTPGFGRGGHGGHHRWAFGGWGPDGGQGRHHHGWHGGEFGGPQGPGGPAMQGDGPDGDGGPDAPPVEPDEKN